MPVPLPAGVLHVVAQQEDPPCTEVIGQIHGLIAAVAAGVQVAWIAAEAIAECCLATIDPIEPYRLAGAGPLLAGELQRLYVVLSPPCNVGGVEDVSPSGKSEAEVDDDNASSPACVSPGSDSIAIV